MDRQERYSWNLLTTWVRFFTSPILREFCKVINSVLASWNVSRKKKQKNENPHTQLQHSELLDSKGIFLALENKCILAALLKTGLLADGRNRETRLEFTLCAIGYAFCTAL